MILARASPRTAKKILAGADHSLVTALSEICLNILNGVIPITAAKKKKLDKFKHNFRSMSGHGGLTTKRKTLQRGGFLGALISVLAPLVLKGVSSLATYIKNKKARGSARAKK